MDKFDEKVIGYESTKEILRQILDILKRPEVYKRKGISIPRGLLMESDPAGIYPDGRVRTEALCFS